MESTYVLNRANKGLCWFGIVASGAAILGAVGAAAYLVCRPPSALSGGAVGGTTFVLVACVVFAYTFACLLAEAREALRFRVVLSDDAVRVGDTTVPCEDIQSIDHPPFTIALAFQITTRDGSKVPVPPVAGARELERLISARLADRRGRGAGAPSPQPVKYQMRAPWRAVLACASWLCFVGAFAAAAGIAGHAIAGGGTTPFAEVPLSVLVPGTFVSDNLMRRFRSLSEFKAVVSGRAILIGEVARMWDEIDQIEHVSILGVAFRVRMRGGRKLSVYSGLENVAELEHLIGERLGAAGA